MSGEKDGFIAKKWGNENDHKQKYNQQLLTYNKSFYSFYSKNL